MTPTRSRVRSHTRVVNGKRQRVRPHRRQLQPSRARANVRRAWRLARRKQSGTALALVGLAVAELGAWFTLRGFSLFAVTIGIAALGIGVAARRATP